MLGTPRKAATLADGGVDPGPILSLFLDLVHPIACFVLRGLDLDCVLFGGGR
jgi:hypothetical protein